MSQEKHCPEDHTDSEASDTGLALQAHVLVDDTSLATWQQETVVWRFDEVTRQQRDVACSVLMVWDQFPCGKQPTDAESPGMRKHTAKYVAKKH